MNTINFGGGRWGGKTDFLRRHCFLNKRPFSKKGHFFPGQLIMPAIFSPNKKKPAIGAGERIFFHSLFDFKEIKWGIGPPIFIGMLNEGGQLFILISFD